MWILNTFGKAVSQDKSSGIIESGKNKKSGGHDHTTNKGDDRTPAQKAGDAKRKK